MTWIVAATGMTFGAALSCLALFFVTSRERFDRIAEWLFVAFAILAVPTVLAVASRLPSTGPIVPVVSAIGIVGAVGIGVGELATTLRVIDFRRLAPWVTGAFLAFVAWIGLVALEIVMAGGLPVALGWFGLATVGAGLLIVVSIVRRPGVLRGEVEPPRTQLVAFIVPMAGIVVWLVWLGVVL